MPIFFSYSPDFRKIRISILAFCWCGGIAAGLLLARYADEFQFSLMRRAAVCPVSIVGLLSVLLPFLFTAFAVFVSNWWLIPCLAFCKGLLFGYHACIVTAAFGSAGWLVRYLLLFTDTWAVLILIWCWMQVCRSVRSRSLSRVGFCMAAALVLGMVDICFVSPFLAMLIS